MVGPVVSSASVLAAIPYALEPWVVPGNSGLPAGFPAALDTQMAWVGKKFENDDGYIYRLTDEDIVEAESALQYFKSRCLEVLFSPFVLFLFFLGPFLFSFSAPTSTLTLPVMYHPLTGATECYWWPLKKANLAAFSKFRTLKPQLAFELDGSDVSPDNFPLPTLGPKLRGLAHDVYEGRGFCVIRGLDVGKYSVEDATMIWLGLQGYIARQQARQDKNGNMLGMSFSLTQAPNVLTILACC